MNRGRVAFALLLVSFLLAGNLFAQIQPIPKNLASGQAAHFVLGQMNFSDITGATSQVRMESISGIAIAGNKLIVADSTFLTPDNNNRVLIYNDLNALKARPPQNNLPPADVVLGQVNFESSSAGTSARSFNEPVGVATDGVRLFVADWGNNRILIYNKIPETSGAAADVVVGQPNFTSAAFSASPQGLRRPNSVFSDGSRMLVADTLNNRILIYRSIPTQNGAAADVVVGQPNFSGSQVLPTSASTLSAPMSATTDGQRLILTDLGNNRVLIYNRIPTQSGAPADVVVGQPDFVSKAAGNTQTSLNFPRYAYSDGTRLVIVDTGNNRILIYNQVPTQNGAAADVVIGQNDFFGLMESCAASNFAIPYAVASDGDMLYVSDGLNRRVLGFRPGSSNVSLSGVVNAASFSTTPQVHACQVTLPQPPLAPGGIISIFGSGLADTITQPDSLPLPTDIGGVRVKFNGILAPLFYVSPSQINVQVPFEVTGYSASMEIEKKTSTGTVVSAAVPVGLANGAPGIFTLDGSGTGPGIIVHGDFSPVTQASPAMPGETIILLATGLGSVNNIVVDGAAAMFGAQGSVTIGGTPSAGQTATIVVQGRPYSYTTVTGDTLDSVTIALATLINNNDPNVSATADVSAEKVDLTARIAGDAGLSITFNAFVPSGGTLVTTVNNPIAVPGVVSFSGTAEANDIVEVILGGTAYQYTTTALDTVETVINGLVKAINADPNVVATADIPDGKILLKLINPNSGLVVMYSADVQPAGSTLVVVTDNPHLTPGLGNVINTVTATIGKGLPLVPGTISFGGILQAGQTVTVTLQTTPYSYTTTGSDTFQSLVTNLTNLLNTDPNVTATANLTNLQISLALKTAGSSQQITFTVTTTSGSTLIVVPQSATTSGSETAAVAFAGLVPGFVGLYQVNFTVPTDQAANTAADLTIKQNLIVFGSTTSTDIVSNDVTFAIGTASQ